MQYLPKIQIHVISHKAMQYLPKITNTCNITQKMQYLLKIQIHVISHKKCNNYSK